jgi:hypothetical protein
VFSSVTFGTMAPYQYLGATRMAWTNLIDPMPTEEPPVGGIGRRITATYTSLQSAALGTWETLWTMRTSAEVGGWKQPQKTSEVSKESQRGHSTRNAGKPRTRGRATVLEVFWTQTNRMRTRRNLCGCR